MANYSMTEVRLLSVPLEKDYIHTFYFWNLSEQTSYFLGKSRADKTYSNLTYQRKDNFIRIPDHYDSILRYNYVMYKNAAHSNKWFYAFITDITYVDEGRTDITIETDVIQTWLFDYIIKDSFIEREHVDFDGIGYHTVPERVELGEYICNKHTKANYCDEKSMSVIVGTTKTPGGDNVSGSLYNNIYSGVKYYAFNNNSEGAAALQDWLSGFAENGAAEAITCMFLLPNRLFSLDAAHSITNGTLIDIQNINSGETESYINTEIDMTDKKLDGYTPKNNKLLTYPYRYLLVSNNAGCSVPFQYEQFKKTENGVTTGIDPRFRIEGCLCPGGSIRMIPINYKGEGRFDEEGINLGKFPALNWTSDVYTNWLTQNGLNIALSIGSSALTAVGGIGLMATGAGAMAGVGAVASGALGIANAVGEVYSHSMQPPQAQGNLNSGDVVTASGNNDFHFYDMSIKSEYAVIIDNYFSMFGYKVNRVKKPSFAHRENYWYTKTIDVNIDGAIPTKDLQKIKDCYNRGITFWYNPANIGNYSVSNQCTG